MTVATYISLSAAAEQCGISERTMRRYIAEGKLPAYRLGKRQIRVKSVDLDALLVRIPTAGMA
jgi:excisionase family DNA binding protein